MIRGQAVAFVPLGPLLENDRKRKIEYLDERDKWFEYLDTVVIGIFIAIGVIGPIAVLIALFLEAVTKYQMPFQNAMRSAGVQFIVLLPFLSPFEYIIYAQVYDDITSSGVYYLNERGIQLEYCMHVCREIRWDEIDRIERRTIDTGAKYPFDENEIFFICKKGCSEKEKKPKTRSAYFYVNHRKRVMLIGYSKVREEEFRQYWKAEIRDQRKWTRGMNLF